MHTASHMDEIRIQFKSQPLPAGLFCFQELEARCWSSGLLLGWPTWALRVWALVGTYAESRHGCWLGMLPL
jgi:hypothetical protein